MSDIINRLRTNRECLAPCLMDEAAAEIERLRAECERLRIDGLRHIDTLVTERDEARREACESDTDTHGGALLEAERRGWDCFKEGT